MELEFLRWLQGMSHPLWDGLFLFLTVLGEPLLPVLILSSIYWLWDTETGEYLGFTLLSSLLFNNVIKNILRLPRPIGEEGIRSLRVETATGWSFPSGHTQTVSTLGFSLGVWYRRKWIWWASAILSALVALSRMYLGVHYPKDVAFGLLFGVSFPFLCHALFTRVRRRELLYGLILLAALPFVLLRGDGDLYDVFGLSVGFAVGTACQRRFVRLSRRGLTPLRSLRRWCAGIALLAAVLLLLKCSLPVHPFFHALRYCLLSFLALGGCPWLFKKLRI